MSVCRKCKARAQLKDNNFQQENDPKQFIQSIMHLNIIHLPHRIDRQELMKKELVEQDITDYTIWDGIINPNIIAKGISQAHKQIIKYAKDKELEEVLVAEDDFKFTDKGAFKYFLENKPSDYDIYLSSIYFGEITDGNIVEDFSGLTFYIIHKRFFDTFLSMTEHDNLDRSLRKKGKYIVCNPFTVIQQNGFSDNKKEYCDYSNYLKNRKLYTNSYT